MPFLRSGKEVDLQKEVPKKNNKKNKKTEKVEAEVAKDNVSVQEPKEEAPVSAVAEEVIDAIVIDQTFLPDKPIVQIKGDNLVQSKSISNCSIC